MSKSENQIPTPETFPLSSEDTQDMIGDQELKVLMLQFNPGAFKDIDLIEKGVENFFLFNQSPFALTKVEQLQHLKLHDLKFLEERKGVQSYQFLQFQKEIRELQIANVIIRPASLKADQIVKVKRGCLLQSVAAILEMLYARDQFILNTSKNTEIEDWVHQNYLNVDDKGMQINLSDSKFLEKSMQNLESLSLEFLLSRLQVRGDLFSNIFQVLNQKPGEILNQLSIIKVEPEVLQAIEKRGSRAPLLQLHSRFHLFQPSLDELLSFRHVSKEKGEQAKFTELEIIFDLFTVIARKILLQILPGEESSWIELTGNAQAERYLEELKKHPAFTSGKSWMGGGDFIKSYEVLLQTVRTLEHLKKESLINLITVENLFRFKESKEPVHFDLSNFEVDDAAIKSVGMSRAELFREVLERIRVREDFLKKERKSGSGETIGLTILAKAMILRAFIEVRPRRTSIHNLIRQNGYPRGIYEFLKEVSDVKDGQNAVDEQIRLSKAIAEWEEDAEKERIRSERASKSILERIIEFILSLFGIKISPRETTNKGPIKRDSKNTETTDHTSSESSKPKKKKSLGVIVGPKEKEMIIPARVQKAIDYVDRKNNGLIWLDEIVVAVSSPEFGKDKVADLIYYDQKRRYLEIRAMNQVRHVFIRRELESDPTWIQTTLDYLDNVSAKKPEFSALADTLRRFQNE
ncbi:hypothetical protein [Leptospira santarosai]|uniref:Uncharacterized protein n=1 Tax=Leptospira santarosai serovar Shermani str. LT 821 TaxID=758847 RepID=K8Y2Q4_9LEPT|nr:hypothetical protein [Leptospira santarosai]EKS09948.1 hypothetical protein LEP1GSC071_2321 [Leptospira santarosai str. JET]EKT87883.1 hypothetical protein LSS_04556 [Leptospira santarosai serovar Shermani str. LT 821]EPG81028.1 hypothetical protein LEP1GSC048_2242 [Leptospira santarosai serovar Shermani str. 1342KT]MDI7202587.1 hypothetical protein [Leptospira santarosai]